MSDEKFEGAKFVANFHISKESIDEQIATHSTKRVIFQRIVETALDRVKNDLVTEMTLKDPDTFVRKISDEEIDKFVQYGIRITITGRIKE